MAIKIAVCVDLEDFLLFSAVFCIRLLLLYVSMKISEVLREYHTHTLILDQVFGVAFMQL